MSVPPRLLLDAGALVDVESHPRGTTLRRCTAAYAVGSPHLLPAVVLAQVWRPGARRHALAVLRQVCQVVDFTERTADEVGLLLTASGTSDVVDAAVVVAAVQHGAVVVTSDDRDIRRLALAAGVRLPLIHV